MMDNQAFAAAALRMIDLDNELTTADDVLDAIQKARKNPRISDIHLDPSDTLGVRIDGDFEQQQTRLTGNAIDHFIEHISQDKDAEKDELDKRGHYSVIHESNEIGRIRATILPTKSGKVVAIRLLPGEPPTLEDLSLPSIFRRMAETTNGLSIVGGPTGKGKSTALAAVGEEVNRTHKRLMYTIDDAMEYVFKNKVARVRQLRVGRGLDFPSYETALGAMLRADPDYIIVSECRTPDSLLAALMLAEAGRRVLITLHIENGARVVDRVVGAFEPAMQPNVRAMLAGVLQEVVYMRLPKRITPTERFGRIPACEMFYRNEHLAGTILQKGDGKGEADSTEAALKNYITSNVGKGMGLLEDDLARLARDKIITAESAWEEVLRPDELSAKLGPRPSTAASIWSGT